MDHPPTQYTKTADGTHLALQVLGEGPIDLVYLAPWFSHLEFAWQESRKARFLRRLATFSRLILFDRRGQGLSDHESSDRPATFEARIDDIVSVMDAVDSKRAVIYGASETGPMAALFAAIRPDRALALVIHGTDAARTAWAPDWLVGVTATEQEARINLIDRSWGTEDFVRAYFPSFSDDAPLVTYIAALQRHSMSPGAAIGLERWVYDIDVRDALRAVHAPTLILHRIEDDPEANRYFAEQIPGARLVQLPGREHIPYLGDQDSVTVQIERFVRGLNADVETYEGSLATILVTSLSGSSRAVSRVRRALGPLLQRYRGRLINPIGSADAGVFDGPTRAVRCGLAIVAASKSAGVSARVGIHVGEINLGGDSARGLAVALAAELHRRAGRSEVLASHSVRDMTIGSDLAFEDVGTLALEGSPDAWRAYRVTEPAESHGHATRPGSPGRPRLWDPSRHDGLNPNLTPREGAVLRLLASGRSDGEIAETLHITKKTASVHVSNIKGKLGTTNRVETALRAQQLRLA